MTISFLSVCDQPRELEQYISAAHDGIPVFCFYLDDPQFRHPPLEPTYECWTEKELTERTSDFHQYFIERTRGWGTGFNEAVSARYGRQANANCVWLYDPNSIQKQYVNQASDLLGLKSFKQQLIVLALPAKIWQPEKVFAHISGVPSDILEDFPTTTEIYPVTMRHEYEHVFQAPSTVIKFANPDLELLYAYECELAADAAAINEIGTHFPKGAQAWLLARAVSSALESAPRYYTALSLDDLVNKRPVLDYEQQIVPAVREVRARLIGEARGTSLARLTSAEIQKAIQQPLEHIGQSTLLTTLLENEISYLQELKAQPREAIRILWQLNNEKMCSSRHSVKLLALVAKWIESYCPTIAHKTFHPVRTPT